MQAQLSREIICVETPNKIISWDYSRQIVKSEYKNSNLTIDAFVEASLIEIQYLRKYNASSVILNRKNLTFSSRIESWFQQVYLPTASKYGLRKLAILTHHLDAKANIIHTPQYEVKYFDTLEAAENWIVFG